MDHISRAWGVVSRDLVAWIVLVLVAGCAIVLTCGLGTLLVGPNLVLATKRAIDRGVAPEIGDLFQTDLIVEYVVYWIILIVLSVVGGWVPLIGTLLVSVLTFWTLPLIIDRRFGAIDAIQASFHHAKGAFFDLLVFTIILYVIAFLGTCACVVGLFVAVPVSMVATWLYYQAERQNILAAAINAGLKPLP
jgi:uncharacterized membrane protein